MKRLFLLLLCATFAMVGCEGLNPEDLQGILDNISGPEEPVFYVTEDGDYMVSSEGGDVEVEVITNLEYAVSIHSEAKAWVTLSETRVIRVDKIHFAVAKNETSQQRRATVDLLSLEGEVLQSINIVQEAGVSGEVPEEDGIVLTADKKMVCVGDTVTFTVIDDSGEDVTENAQIYDVSLNVVERTLVFDQMGRYKFFATLGEYQSDVIEIVVADGTALCAPEDPNPSNFAFHHKPLIIRHVGMNCGYCPIAYDQMEKVKASEWGEYYNEVTCHAGMFASGDPANSNAANMLHEFQSSLIQGYPTTLIDFYTSPSDYSYNSVISSLQSRVKIGGADVGIALSVDGDSQDVYCTAQIKSAVSQEYKVNAWLLESDIYSPHQAGAAKDAHKYYDYAIRNMSSENSSRTNVQGDSVGVIEAGSTYDFAAVLPITSSKWNVDNMGVVIVVSALDGQNRWDVVNTAYCPIYKSLAYRYVGDPDNLGDAEYGPDYNEENRLETPVITSVSVQEDSITMTWSPVENAIEYCVSLSGDLYYTNETSYTFEGLNRGNYTVRVKAKGAEGEQSNYSKSQSVAISGPSSVDWFKQSVYLPEDNEENAKREINSSNTIQFRWWGDGVESLRYMLCDADNLPVTEEDIIYEMYDLDEGTLSSVNSAEGVEFMFRELTGGKTYVLCVLATKGDKEFFVKDEITTNDTILTLGTEAWLGQWNAYTTQIVDVTTHSFRDERTDFTLTITPYEDSYNRVWVDGFSVLGEGAPAAGYVYHEQVDGEYTGNYCLVLMCYETISVLDEYSGIYAVWMPYCLIEDSDYAFVHGSFGAYTLTLNPTTGAVTCEAYKGLLLDERSFEVKMMDVFSLNTSDYELYYMTNEEGNEITEYKAGGIMGVSKQTSISSLSRTATRKMKCSDIPASVVVYM